MRGFDVHHVYIDALRQGLKTQYRKHRVPFWSKNPKFEVLEVAWVKESHREHQCTPDSKPMLLYRGDGKYCPACNALIRWHGPKLMTEDQSRFRIKITDIQAQVLQKIKAEDVIKEGLYLHESGLWTTGYHRGKDLEPLGSKDPVKAFALTWDFCHEPYGPFWCDSDASVWVYRFELVQAIPS